MNAHTTTLTLLASVLSTLTLIPMASAQPSQTPPVAQPAPPPVAQPAPPPVAQPETTTEQPQKPRVSQINGQLVKVGEHNDYYYEYKHTNISIDALGLVYGNYSLSASHGLNDHVAIRGNFTIYNNLFSNENADGFQVDLTAPLYLRRTYQGIFVEPGVLFRDLGHDGTTLGPQVLMGYHSTWDSGFNFSLASGLGRDLDTSGYFFNGYIRVGYAF